MCAGVSHTNHASLHKRIVTKSLLDTFHSFAQTISYTHTRWLSPNSLRLSPRNYRGVSFLFFPPKRTDDNIWLIHQYRIYQLYRSANTLCENHGNPEIHTNKIHSTFNLRTLVLYCTVYTSIAIAQVWKLVYGHFRRCHLPKRPPELTWWSPRFLELLKLFKKQ